MGRPVEHRTHKRGVEARRPANVRSSHIPTHPYRTWRREAAEERAAAWRMLSTEEQLRELRARPGECRRQIERLSRGKKQEVVSVGTPTATPEKPTKAPPKSDVKASKAFEKKHRTKEGS
jgi:hypothetical protein